MKIFACGRLAKVQACPLAGVLMCMVHLTIDLKKLGKSDELDALGNNGRSRPGSLSKGPAKHLNGSPKLQEWECLYTKIPHPQRTW